MKMLIRVEVQTVCQYCQKPARALWATSADRALQGYGLCDDCKKLADKDELPMQRLANVDRTNRGGD